MNHDFSVYDLNLCLLGSNGGKDLLGEARKKELYLLDSNSVQVGLVKKCQELNFLIGRTAMQELEDPYSTFVRKDKVEGLDNLYVFGTEKTEGEYAFVIHKSNEFFEGIYIERWKKLSDLSDFEREEFNSGTKSANSIDLLNQIRRKSDNEILNEIEMLNRNPMSVDVSIRISLCAFALYLNSTPTKSSNKKKLKKVREAVELCVENALGDAILIQEALFLGASVVSEDVDTRKIGEFAGVEVVKPEDLEKELTGDES